VADPRGFGGGPRPVCGTDPGGRGGGGGRRRATLSRAALGAGSPSPVEDAVELRDPLPADFFSSKSSCSVRNSSTMSMRDMPPRGPPIDMAAKEPRDLERARVPCAEKFATSEGREDWRRTFRADSAAFTFRIVCANVCCSLKVAVIACARIFLASFSIASCSAFFRMASAARLYTRREEEREEGQKHVG
jgi:hypothetical protein